MCAMLSGMTQEDDIFDKIIHKEIPAEIIYEDTHTLAFLDIAPVSLGHTLVISKKHVRNIFDVDHETLSAVMETVRKIAPAVRDAVGAKGMQISSNHEDAGGQVVFHLHIHLIPRLHRNEFEFWPKIECSPEETTAIAEKIREQLN